MTNRLRIASMRPPVWAEPACTFGTYWDSGVKKRMRKLQFTLLDRQRDSLRSGLWLGGLAMGCPADAMA
jgi:hypothetical protein